MRYVRIDNFWFTLMHGLVHVIFRLEDNGKAAFFGDLDVKESSRMEKVADEMAENTPIPAELWASSGARENPIPMAVYGLSQRAGVDMAVAADRGRCEHNNCRLLSQSVGRRSMVGPVRLDAPYFSNLVV